jgi:hypothetical protein
MKRSNDLDSYGIRLSPLTIAWQTVLKPAIQIVEMNPGLAARASVFTATAVKYQASGARPPHFMDNDDSMRLTGKGACRRH